MIHSQKSRFARRGFTLIELLAVIAIVGVLAAILILTLGRVRKSAQGAVCENNLRQIGAVSLLWMADNKGRLPGSGTLASTGFSASWQDVFNYALFPAYQNGSVAVLQRMGDTPVSGQMYCPSMERWSSSALQQSSVRAYVMNTNAYSPTGAVNMGAFGAFSAYKSGALYNAFGSPSRTFYVWDSEMTTDSLQVTAAGNVPGGSGQIVWDNSAGDTAKDMSPYSANNRAYSFRHGGTMNILFLDGHVAKLTSAQMAALNVVSSFTY
jgi:prepilin-type N-terminal cleavage/methylation domain-containing protein/prepilin-type processing-associated H-X9-DG protein